ncbi:MAG: endonuclease [Schlesneria sp.]|nr:endonuclease [Schlesneria sp.]
MAFRITMDCGVGWNEHLDSKAPYTWGVSQTQQRIAKNIAEGDILLHYIVRPRAWAGYSLVLNSVQGNNRDSLTDREAHPVVIPIECGVWLDMDQCPHTREIPGLSVIQYHRKPTFTVVNEDDATRIKEAIDAAKTKQSKADKNFTDLWAFGSDNYYWPITRAVAAGRCWLCGETAADWEKKHLKLQLSEDELKKLRRDFIDIAHIKARAVGGPITPDNVRALCPTCHRMVDRLSPERKLELMAEKSHQSQTIT